MQRPVWKGDISFGLVSIPVAIVPAEEKNDLTFHLLDSRDHTRVRYQRINTHTGKEVPWNQIAKGYEYDKGSYVIIDEEELKREEEAFHEINIEEFVDLKEIDYLYFEKPYYIIPDSKNKKAYVLLREALKKSNKVGVAKVIIRTKEYLSLILPHQHALLLYLVRFKQEIRDEESLNIPKEALKAYKITDREIKMGMDLIKSMTGKWHPEKYHDEYREMLAKWIESKTEREAKSPATKKKGKRKNDDIVDFISLLKQSMKKNKNKAALKKKSSK